jgi:hypothetical protein
MARPWQWFKLEVLAGGFKMLVRNNTLSRLFYGNWENIFL